MTANNRRRCFEVRCGGRTLPFPYVCTRPSPSRTNAIQDVWVDGDLGNEAFSYALRSGAEGTVHVEQVLEYNRDPGYLRDQLLYRLTVEAQERLEKSELSKREIIRRLQTSASQFYRLLNPTNYAKSIGQMLTLLHVLDCEVDFVVKRRRPRSA